MHAGKLYRKRLQLQSQKTRSSFLQLNRLDSILFPDVKIEKGARVDKAIMGENSVAGEESVVGIPVEVPEEPNGITIIENNLKIQPGTRVESGTECTL